MQLLLNITVVLYLFSILNSSWIKVKLPVTILKVLKVIHLILLPLFTIPIITLLANGSSLFFKGYYTNFTIFWGFLITGFLVSGFELAVIKGGLLKVYLYLLQYIWLLLLPFIFVPFLGLLMIYPFSYFGSTPGKIVYSDEEYRIEKKKNVSSVFEHNAFNAFLFVEKRKIITKKNLFTLPTETFNVPPHIVKVDIKARSERRVLATISYKEDFNADDSTVKTITEEIELE